MVGFQMIVRLSALRSGRVLSPERSSDTHFCQRLSKLRTVVQLEGLGTLKKKYNDSIGIRTLDFAVLHSASTIYATAYPILFLDPFYYYSTYAQVSSQL
jgi:hypothetical protein